MNTLGRVSKILDRAEQICDYIQNHLCVAVNLIYALGVIAYLLVLGWYNAVVTEKFGVITWDYKTWDFSRAYDIINHNQGMGFILIFLGVVLLIVLIILTIYCYKHCCTTRNSFGNERTVQDFIAIIAIVILNGLLAILIMSALNSPLIVAFFVVAAVSAGVIFSAQAE